MPRSPTIRKKCASTAVSRVRAAEGPDRRTAVKSQTELSYGFAPGYQKTVLLVGPGAKDLRVRLRDWLAPRSGDLTNLTAA